MQDAPTRDQVPEGNTMYLSPYKASEERDTEYFDYLTVTSP